MCRKGELVGSTCHSWYSGSDRIFREFSDCPLYPPTCIFSTRPRHNTLNGRQRKQILSINKVSYLYINFIRESPLWRMQRLLTDRQNTFERATQLLISRYGRKPSHSWHNATLYFIQEAQKLPVKHLKNRVCLYNSREISRDVMITSRMKNPKNL